MKTLLSVVATLILLSASSPDRHLRLTESTPEKDSTLTEVPTEIRLWFNQNIHMNVSEITLHHVMSQDGMTHEMPVELPAAQASEDPKSFFVPLPDSLGIGNGAWKVTWATAGNDEHVVDGSFTFSIDSE